MSEAWPTSEDLQHAIFIESEKRKAGQHIGEAHGALLAAARSFLRISPDDGEWPEELKDQIAGLLSTISIQPSRLHPEAMRPWAAGVLRIVYDFAKEETE